MMYVCEKCGKKFDRYKRRRSRFCEDCRKEIHGEGVIKRKEKRHESK